MLTSHLKPFFISLKPLALLACLILFSGCSSMGGKSTQANRIGGNGSDQKTIPPRQNITHELVKQGIEYLREGDYQSAQKVFSAAVKMSPSSSTAHLLNGISYHLEYLNSSSDNKELAETAYGLAASLDKTDTLPLIQMGRLHIDSGEYLKASKDFISAYAISPSSQDALFGLLQSSLWQKDFKTALWAGDGLQKLNTSNVDQLRLMSLMYAAVGKTTESKLNLDAYAKANANNPKQIDQLKQQITYISTQLSNLKSMDLDVAQNPASLNSSDPQRGKMMKVAERGGGASTSGAAAAPAGGNATAAAGRGGNSVAGIVGTAAAVKTLSGGGSSSSDGSSSGSSGSSGSPGVAAPSGSTSASAAAVSGGGGGGTYTAVSMANQQQRWFDCDTKPGLGKAPGGSYGVPVGGTSGDQTLYLEPLPSPCSSMKPPKMASIDAVLIRTVDTQGSQYGINLLTGLNMFAGSQSFRSTGSVAGASVSGTVQNSVIGIGTATSAAINSVSGLVSYSLNIANSTSSNSQVIARPTLTALDRIPSTFYSGAVITAGLNGGGISGAQITNIPTGVSLSVTPTFVDEESMMLAVKVSRSLVSSTATVGGFNASVSQEQHAVTANVRIKYGETLILDGLSSRSISGSQDGVPVLQDIPIIQYLFNQKKQSLYSENVVVLVTPRKVQNEEEMAKAAANADKDQQPLSLREKNVLKAIQLYKQIASSSDANLDNTLLSLDRDSSYFRSFASSALNQNLDSWVTEPKINKFFDDAGNLLYFTK